MLDLASPALVRSDLASWLLDAAWEIKDAFSVEEFFPVGGAGEWEMHLCTPKGAVKLLLLATTRLAKA
ncbi:hypothetical protein SH661x_001850 [Planctomicrobium sp. SH661]|uniref:hypothetical protein n=1 Tax=Planctomicrobium sp. SH661 TaxID=3448124 RepID=UPI003F5BC4C9